MTDTQMKVARAQWIMKGTGRSTEEIQGDIHFLIGATTYSQWEWNRRGKVWEEVYNITQGNLTIDDM